MKRLILFLSFWFATTLVAFGQFASGRYQATLDLGPDNRQALVLVLNIEGNSVNGSIWPDSQHPLFFRDGTVNRNEISFSAGGIDTKLTIDGTTLRGFASPHGGSVKWPFEAKRIGDLTLEDRFPPSSLNEIGSIRSQRILALRESLQRGVPDAENSLWRQIQNEGAPIVERVPGHPDHALVTFIWHGSATTRNVLLERGRFTRFTPQQNLLAHIEGTDVWFKTLVLPSASRFRYAFSENDPAATFPPGDGQSSHHYDVLNKRHVPEDASTPNSDWFSVLELQGAAPQPWYERRSAVSRYVEKTIVLHSEILHEERQLKIYTPPGYPARAKAYPVMYLFDGEDPDGLVFASWTVENLVATHRIPPVVVVRIVNPSPAIREKELGCMPEYTEFLSHELVPFVRSHYRVTSDPQLTGIGGYSRGGLAAAYAGLRHPETFGRILVQSGAFWWEPGERADPSVEPNWLAKQYVSQPRLPLQFYLEAGLFEVDLQGSGGDILETTRTFRDVLQAKRYVVSYNEFAGDHDYINWRGTFANGLIALFGADPKNGKGL